jgi:hypothetical protein
MPYGPKTASQGSQPDRLPMHTDLELMRMTYSGPTIEPSTMPTTTRTSGPYREPQIVVCGTTYASINSFQRRHLTKGSTID